MSIWIRSIFCLLLLMGSPLTAEENEPSPVKIEVLLEEKSIQPGHPFWVAIQVDLKDSWHLYWKNPGSSGMAPVIEWQLPENFETSPIEWPVPERFISNDKVSYGYSDKAIFLTQVTPPSDLSMNSLKIGALMQWVACSDTTCMPGESTAEIEVPVNKQQPSSNPTSTKIIQVAKEALPVKSQGTWAEYTDKEIKIHITPSIELPQQEMKALFFPESEMEELKDDLILRAFEDHYILAIPTLEAPKTDQLKGIISLKGGNQSIEIDTPLLNYSEASIAEVSEIVTHDSTIVLSEIGLLAALGLAFLGGFILNLMPCVLPVISFKILSFVKMAGQQRALTLKHGAAFALGILVSFWFLAAVLLLLQAYGNFVGWGFQLQEPIFVAILAAILFALGLSLFNVFETGAFVISLANKANNYSSPRSKEGLSSSFFSGILATAVATPCTGPFLGSAIGFAVTAPALYAMLIFTSLGLGMAFPYLVLAAFPQLLRFLPKQGAWMNTFKELMGFIMFATVIWLVWVFGAQTSSFAIMLLLIALFFVAIACWIYGKWGSPMHSRAHRILSILFAAGCLSMGGFLVHAATWQTTTVENDPLIAWESFSPERVANLRKQNVPILIDFTAKWCLICQSNHLAFSSKKVKEKFKELGVVKMKADWTKNDPVITKELRKYGRSGVPLYLLYSGDPDKPPQILPQILTSDIVLQNLKSLEI